MSQQKIFRLIIGSLIMGAGISIAMRSGLGLDPMALFWEGIQIQTSLSFGVINLIVSALMFILIYFFDKSQLNIGTIVNTLLVTLSVDLVSLIPFAPSNVGMGIVFFIVGCVLFAFGIAYYGSTNIGRGAYDGLMFGIIKHTHSSIRLTRSLMDVSLVLLGMLLGAQLKIGTILNVLCFGILIQFFYEKIGMLD